MSFGVAVRERDRGPQRGAARGGFAHDTGEGGISRYHRKHGGDLIWEIASGYFVCRTPDGNFDPDQFAAKASDEPVKAISSNCHRAPSPASAESCPAPRSPPRSREAARCRSARPSRHHPRTGRSAHPSNDRLRHPAPAAVGRQNPSDSNCASARASSSSRSARPCSNGTSRPTSSVDVRRAAPGPGGRVRGTHGHAAHRGLIIVHNALVGAGVARPREDLERRARSRAARTSSNASSRAPTSPSPPAR